MDENIGLAIGVVKANEDPMKLARVKVTFPGVESASVSDWAQLAAPFGARRSQLPIIPEVGSQVVVGFVGNDTRQPVVLGQIVSETNR